jgi:hypothetical protein
LYLGKKIDSMEQIEFKENCNEWEVARFIFKHDGMFNEFNDHFSIWQQNKPFIRFKNGELKVIEKCIENECK